jgi:hypothetical protein
VSGRDPAIAQVKKHSPVVPTPKRTPLRAWCSGSVRSKNTHLRKHGSGGRRMAELPQGTVTWVFTDIKDSTQGGSCRPA